MRTWSGWKESVRLKNILHFSAEGFHFDVSGNRKCLSSLDAQHRDTPRFFCGAGHENRALE